MKSINREVLLDRVANVGSMEIIRWKKFDHVEVHCFFRGRHPFKAEYKVTETSLKTRKTRLTKDIKITTERITDLKECIDKGWELYLGEPIHAQLRQAIADLADLNLQRQLLNSKESHEQKHRRRKVQFVNRANQKSGTQSERIAS